MEINDIRDVQAICRYGSFRQAAIALGTTQATLTNRVQHLEIQLGEVLFHRTPGKSTSTALARFIADRADNVLAGCESLIKQTLEVSKGNRGHLRIGFGPSCGRVLLSRIVRSLRTAGSSITLECHMGTTDTQMHALAQGDLDLVIGPFDQKLGDDRVDAELLFEDVMVAVVHPQHPLALNPPDNPEELFKYPLATVNLEPRYLKLVDEHYGHAMESWNKRVTCSNYEVLLQLIEDKNYVTAGPRFAFQREIDAGQVKVFSDPHGAIPHPEFIVRNLNTFPYPALRQFVDVVKREAGKIENQIIQARKDQIPVRRNLERRA